MWVPNAPGCSAGCAYFFGGWDGAFLRDIVRYDPDTGGVATMAARLPRGFFSGAAVWDPRDRPEDGCGGGCAYLVGGREGVDGLEAIVQYHPGSDGVRTMAGRLPSARWHVDAVWTGTEAVLFGGCTADSTACASSTRQVVRYDPVDDVVTVAASSFPFPVYGVAAAWDPEAQGCLHGCAYVLGGWTRNLPSLPIVGPSPGPAALTHIWRYDPAADTLVPLPSALPQGRGDASAVFDGTSVYLLGGCISPDDWLCSDPPAGTAEVLRWDPGAGLGTATPAGTLPMALFGHRAAWDGATAHVAGGCCPVTGAIFPWAPESSAILEETLLDQQASLPVGLLPPVDLGVASVTVRDEGAYLCVDVTVTGSAPQNVACAERAILGPVAEALPRGTVPFADLQELHLVGNATTHVTAAYHYDASRLFASVTLLGGQVQLYRPFEPTPAGATWFATHGSEVGLSIRVAVTDDTGPVTGSSVVVPWLGQVLATAALQAGS